jgi:hypothetical protein
VRLAEAQRRADRDTERQLASAIIALRTRK